MGGKGKKNENEGEGEGGSGSGGGWVSTFWKVASAVASVLKQPEAEQVVVETNEITVWTPPEKGWLKLNVDGSLLRMRDPPSAGCGGVLRDDSGKWVKGFAQKLDPSLREDQTEKEAILKGLKWAKEKGFRRVEVESDHKVTVDMVKDGNEDKDGYIVAIGELLVPSHDWQATLDSIPRDANGVADKLADIASQKLTSFHLKEFHSPPERSCFEALAKDSPHLYY